MFGAAAAAAADRRVPVDPNAVPWNTVAKVQTTIGSRCTGVLVAPDTVLTAAHCLYNTRTRAFLQPLSLHVLLGFVREQYRWHRLVASIMLGPRVATAPWPPTDDWARLRLNEPVPLAPLAWAASISADAPALLAGYNQDRREVLMADLDCRVTQASLVAGGATLIRHDCSGTHGTSGGPLLARHGDRWELLGINIAAGRDSNLALSPAQP